MQGTKSARRKVRSVERSCSGVAAAPHIAGCLRGLAMPHTHTVEFGIAELLTKLSFQSKVLPLGAGSGKGKAARPTGTPEMLGRKCCTLPVYFGG
jgi:hypothetical protein